MKTEPKYRYTFSAAFPGMTLTEQPVKIAARPSLQLVEKENKDGSYKIETQAWSPIITTFYSDGFDGLADLYKLLAKFYDFGAYLFKAENPGDELEKVKGHLGSGRMVVTDASGVGVEEWHFLEMWPHSVNFGDLCYSSSTEVEIEVTWRYKSVRLVKSPAVA